MDEEKFCETCRFWDRYVGKDANFGTCPELLNYRSHIEAQVDSGKVISYETYEDFGCVLWEGK